MTVKPNEVEILIVCVPAGCGDTVIAQVKSDFYEWILKIDTNDERQRYIELKEALEARELCSAKTGEH